MDARVMATLWAQDKAFDTTTQQEAREMLGDEQKLLAAFGTELHFGTGGLRGILGTGTACMNRYTVARATLGLARYLINQTRTPSVAIAHDSRYGSEEFTETAAMVLCAQGIEVHVFDTLAPTPMLSYAVRALHCTAGIMITASHNPAIYNGYKVYGADGCQITDHAAQLITAEIEKVAYPELSYMPKKQAVTKGLWHIVGDNVRRSFAQACLFCRPDPFISETVKVVYTPLHGTGLLPVREVLQHMQGIQVTEVAAQCEPDGAFPTCPKPNPELDETLVLGIAMAKETQADLLLATDPDCDRVGVAVRDAQGEYHRLSGNEVGLLLTEYILRTRRQNGTMPKKPVLVKTIVTSDLAFPIADAYGVEVREVLTGFKYIGEVIGGLEKKKGEDRYVFGFEESCGYLAGTHVRDKDGVMACMLVCEMAQACKREGLTVWDSLCRLYETYGYMGTALLNFDIEGALPMEEMERVMVNMRANPPVELAGKAVTVVKDYAGGIEGLPMSNVLSYATGDGCKAIVRPSGTEPKVKVYLSAKAASRELADELLAQMTAQMTSLIQG
ncbi:MAG: phospho-sugar mutase [Clostridiales bacterium]|nr:phospho-sugar mutase [Clostridiales bacterium]